MPFFVILVVLIAIGLIVKFAGVIAAVVGATVLLIGGMRLVRYLRKRRYFASDTFLVHKAAMAAVVTEHNDINGYAQEVRTGGLFELGGSTTGGQAHLANFQNTSQHKYRRDRNVASYSNAHVHNCSLQVVRSASADPIKYVMKYFGIAAKEATLGVVGTLGESLSRLEAATENLREREAAITLTISPPRFISTTRPSL